MKKLYHIIYERDNGGVLDVTHDMLEIVAFDEFSYLQVIVLASAIFCQGTNKLVEVKPIEERLNGFDNPVVLNMTY